MQDLVAKITIPVVFMRLEGLFVIGEEKKVIAYRNKNEYN